MAGTPFIPPLNTPEGSPMTSPPVIPGSGGSPNMPPGQGWGNMPMGYPMFSPYQNPSPFIPSSPFVAPGVIPGQKHPQTHTRQGLSADWTGYPQGTPFTSPTHPLPGGHPYGQSPLPPPHPTSPWYPTSVPAGYPTFGGTPWPAPAQPFAPTSTPWGMQRNLPPQGPYTPWVAPGTIPPQPGNWGMPPSFFPPQDSNHWMHPNVPLHPQPGPRGPIEPPSQIFDRLDPFMDGDSYGPVLDSKLLHITGAQIRINPLLAPLPEDGPDEVHLKWNMLFPTSTIQRSIDPSHVSWSKGRDSPATFPRLNELRIVSETVPWIIHVKASKEDTGVTCAEVIDAIARDMCRNTGKADFEALPPQIRNEVRAAYKHNRSPLPNVPGGMLGVGLKRLDFLRKHSIFGGIEFKERIIRKVFNDKMPGVFVLKCRQNMMTKTEIEDQHRRMASEREHSRTPSSNGRRSATISVESPTETSSDMGD